MATEATAAVQRYVRRTIGHVLLIILLGGVAVGPHTPTHADTLAGLPVFFPETGHTLAYQFRQFYEANGGLEIFGLPITEVFVEDGHPVQYFERARFEWHATIAQVQVGHLGRWAARDRANEGPFQPHAQAPTEDAGAPGPQPMFFPETGHTLRGPFLLFWLRNGGLTTFGYPLSEEFGELNHQDGQSYVVQYFERARFEWHPEASPAFQVQLGHLGRQYLAASPAPAWALQPVAEAGAAWHSVRPHHISIPRIGVDAAIETTGFSYGEWDVPRYSVAHYWPISAVPGTTGNIVLAGHVGYAGILFSQLPGVTVGDAVVLTVGGEERTYTVTEVLLLLPEDTWVLYPTSTETLTLITCVPVEIYSHRLIVRAVPAS